MVPRPVGEMVASILPRPLKGEELPPVDWAPSLLSKVEEALGRYPERVAGLTPRARRLYTYLLAAGLARLRRMGRPITRALTQVILFVPVEALAVALDIPVRSLYRALTELKGVGLVASRAWYTPATVHGRPGIYRAGVVFAVRLPHRDGRAKLYPEDLQHKWRDHHAEAGLYPVPYPSHPPSPPRLHHPSSPDPIGWCLDSLDPTKAPVPEDRGQTVQQVPPPGLPGITGENGPTKEETPLVHHWHEDVARESPQRSYPHRGLGKREAVDAVAVGQGDRLEVHHLQEALSPREPHGQVSQQPLGLLKDPVEAGEVEEGGEVGLEGGLGGQVAFGEVLALQKEKDGEG